MSVNSSMSSITMNTGSYYSGDSWSTIRTNDQNAAPSSGKDRMKLDPSRNYDNQPIVPGRHSSQSSDISSEFKAPCPGRFSPSTPSTCATTATRKVSSDTTPVPPRRGDLSFSSSCSSQKSEDSRSETSSPKTPGATKGRAHHLRESLAAATRFAATISSSPRATSKATTEKKTSSAASRSDPFPATPESPKPKPNNNKAALAMSPFRALSRMTRRKSLPILLRPPVNNNNNNNKTRRTRTVDKTSSCDDLKLKKTKPRLKQHVVTTTFSSKPEKRPLCPTSLEDSSHTSPTLSSCCSYTSSEDDDYNAPRKRKTPKKKKKSKKTTQERVSKFTDQKPPPIRRKEGSRVSSSSAAVQRPSRERSRVSPSSSSSPPSRPTRSRTPEPSARPAGTKKTSSSTCTTTRYVSAQPVPRLKQKVINNKQRIARRPRKPDSLTIRKPDSLTIILEDDHEDII
jgi:hypothetical protein